MEIITLPGKETYRLVGILGELAAYHNEIDKDFSGSYPIYSLEHQMREAAKMVDDGEAHIDVVMENGDIAGIGMASYSGKNGEIDNGRNFVHILKRQSSSRSMFGFSGI